MAPPCVCNIRFLLQIVLEVACYALVQVDALVATHVVSLAWIDVEVGLGIGSDASLQERVGMLWHYRWVVKANDDLQPAFQVFSLVNE